MTQDPHNLFFYANTCHVCKSKELETKSCGDCKMISYCGKKHQKQHWLQHKDLCHVLEDIRYSTDESNLLECVRYASMDVWVQAKMNLMQTVSSKLERKLDQYEEQMFKFPKACAVCHATNSKLIKNCPNCPCASFCEEHQNDPGHAKICKMLNLCYDLDVVTVFMKDFPRFTIPYQTAMTYLPDSMKVFLDLYSKSLCVSSHIQKVYVSEYLTRPLTLLYAMERLEYTTGSELTIHVIGANHIELHEIEMWEIFMHLLPSLTTLNMILIGPELKSNNEKKKFEIFCDDCVKKGIKRYYEIHGILYKDYVASENFVKPDIIIGYNLGIHECVNIDSSTDTWSQSIKIIPEQKCPFVLTSYTSEEAKKEDKRLCSILSNKMTYLRCEKNPFSSLRPQRCYETEGVFYENQHIIIYKDFERILD